MNIKFKVGDLVYQCERFEDGQYNIATSEVVSICSPCGKSGRKRKCLYKMRCVNCTRGDKDEYETNSLIRYHATKAEAVRGAFDALFSKRASNTAENNMLDVIFGSSNSYYAIENTPRLIADLKRLYGLYAQAIKEDDERIQAESTDNV